MKRILISLLVIVCISCSSLNQMDAYNGWEGKPKEVHITRYGIDPKNSLNAPVQNQQIYRYNSEMREIEIIHLTADSTIASFTKQTFNKKGNVTKSVSYGRDSSIRVTNYYNYNKYGQLLHREYILNNKKSITKYTYDRKGRIMTEEMKNEKGAFSSKIVVKHDKNWNPIESKGYDSLGKQISLIQITNDNKGREIETKWYNNELKLIYIFKHQYNDLNDKIRTDRYDVKNGDTTLSSTTVMEYEYDDRGNIIEERSISNGRPGGITKYKISY